MLTRRLLRAKEGNRELGGAKGVLRKRYFDDYPSIVELDAQSPAG